MSGLRWLQILLLLVIAQPLALLAMPCHTSGSESADALVVQPVEQPPHHVQRNQNPNPSQTLDQAGNMDVLSLAPSAVAFHSCCGTGATCLMSGCAASLLGSAVAELSLSPLAFTFPQRSSTFPDAPVSPLYKPPILL